MSLTYEPSLELLRNTAEQLFSNRELYRHVQKVSIPSTLHPKPASSTEPSLQQNGSAGDLTESPDEIAPGSLGWASFGQRYCNGEPNLAIM